MEIDSDFLFEKFDEAVLETYQISEQESRNLSKKPVINAVKEKVKMLSFDKIDRMQLYLASNILPTLRLVKSLTPRQHPTKQKLKARNTDGQLWTEKYRPIRASDFVGNEVDA